MATPAHRVDDFAQARARRDEAEQTRRDAARRAWEGGEASLKEIAAAAKADPKTVKRWAMEGNWAGGPHGRVAAPAPVPSEGRFEHLGHVLRARHQLLGEDGEG